MGRRELGPARGGHLGDPGWQAAVHLRAADVLGRARPGYPVGRRAGLAGPRPALDHRAGPDPRAGSRPGVERRAAGVRAALPHRCPRRVAAAHADGRVRRAQGPDVDRDARGDGRRAGHRQPGLRGSEGTFSLCTFAYVDAHARAGRVEESRRAFEKMLTYANHVGCSPRRSRSTGSRSATSPRPSPTWRSSTRRSRWTRR